MSDLVTCARDFAIKAHGDQRYGREPYHVHLDAVVQVLRDFRVGDPDILAAGFLHDTMEDAKVIWLDLEREFGGRVADLVLAVSGFGETRRDRNEMIYRQIARHPEAAVLKLADRVANVEASATGCTLRRMYVNERKAFRRSIYPHVPQAAWERLERAYEWVTAT